MMTHDNLKRKLDLLWRLNGGNDTAKDFIVSCHLNFNVKGLTPHCQYALLRLKETLHTAKRLHELHADAKRVSDNAKLIEHYSRMANDALAKGYL